MNDQSARGDADQGGGFRGLLFVWLQYLLPQHGLSRLVLAATRVRTAPGLLRVFLLASPSTRFNRHKKQIQNIRHLMIYRMVVDSSCE